MGNTDHRADTTLTKVFVGGLAWETQEKTLREHFNCYGEIREAVIIYDKVTGRSKGYGFVTFKDAEAAKKACEDATPMINGRRANCNIASLGVGVRQKRAPMPTPPQQPGLAVAVSRSVTTPPPPPAGNGQWYYAAGGAPHPSQLQHHYHGPPFYATYGYTPSYVAEYNVKLNPSIGGPYVYSHPSYAPQGGIITPNGMLPVYPYYNYQLQQSNTMGVRTHPFPTTFAASNAVIPAIISKPPAMPQPAVEQVTV